jgi:hypothetical protein
MAISIGRPKLRRRAIGWLLPMAAAISALILFSQAHQPIPAPQATDARPAASSAPPRVAGTSPSGGNAAPPMQQSPDREQAQRRELLHVLIFHGAGSHPFGFFR